MAGESPDRSKKRESSAEPTPGSASPVPEARGERDPRLAVAREDATPSTAQRGGVDTATKIFSIRELREETETGGSGDAADAAAASEDADSQNPSAKGGPSGSAGPGGSEGDARLRAAVAAWVSSGSDGARPTGTEGSEDAERSAGGETADVTEGSGDVATAEGPEDVEAPAGGETADVTEDSGDVTTAEGPEGAETPAGAPETEDGEDSGETSVSGASKGAEAAQEADTGERAEGAGAGVTGDPEDAEARDSADAEGGSEDADDDVTEGEQVAAAAADPEDDSEADGAPATAEADEADEADADADPHPEAADSEPVSKADKTPVAATTGEASTDADARPEATDNEPVPKADKAPVAATTVDSHSGADARPEAAGTASGDDPKAGESAEAGSAEAEVDEAAAGATPESAEGKTSARATDAKPDGRPEESAEGDTSSGASGPETDESPESAEGKASTDAGGPKTEDRPESAEGRTPSDATPPRTDSRPEAAEGDTAADPRTTGTGTGTEDAVPSGAEPKAADGGKAPEGPPAPGDETRTGGAGGNSKTADGGAEAVDHPTTVFKAVRPPKPAVDQPTTMLKAPPAPKTPETPAERTSRFVALKPLDEPRRESPRRETPPRDATRPVPQVGPEHTTQQPLPPKPPLDLLAELTNTPPPPETPVRTAIRRVKIWTPLVILLAIVFAVVQAVRPLPTPSLTLTADDSYTFAGAKASLPWPSEGQGWMDVNGIGTMGSFGKQTPVAIGSVAKAMTAYIVLKDHPLKAGAEGEKITVDATAEKEGGYDKDGESTLNTVKAGDVLTEKQALSAIMIPSANNIARLLARWDAGSEAAFIKKMNDTAKSLGMTNTTYTDASGLKETTVSSAEDQVKLGNQLVKIQALMDITKLPSWVDPSGHKWTNYNRLVPYNNSLGIKTGTTTAAGGNLLFAATKEVGGETAVVVGAILGQHTAPIIDTVNAVSKTAMLAAQDAMTSAKILKKGTVVGYVDDQLGGHTPVVVTKDVAAVGWAGLKVKLSFAPDAVPHTAKAGTKVGTLTVGDGSSGAVKVPVALQKDLAEPALTSKLTRLG
ncbi:D-alanyl-D-alanine carboxypeptidase [Streptomyces sp. NPDC048504]|uniref:D-alanyl-D-alanine carboxypeptidase n=1 Tax=Streptomyces sp. NPDC048504 TaxID=3365559 RepID=UPI0037201D57